MIIDELFETPQQCPECGGISFSDLILAEKKDACYHKVKASAKVWPSAYASGRLVQCRKKGAANYGNKSEGVAEGMQGKVMFSGTGDNGSTYEIIQSGDDYMIHANGRHIDTYDSLQRAMSVLKNEVPGLQQGVAEGQLEEVDRRGFLKGMGAAAIAGAAGDTKAGWFSSPKLFANGAYSGSVRHYLGAYSDSGAVGDADKDYDITVKINGNNIVMHVHGQGPITKSSSSRPLDFKFSNFTKTSDGVMAKKTESNKSVEGDGYEPKDGDRNNLVMKNPREVIRTKVETLLITNDGALKYRKLSYSDSPQEPGWKYHAWGYKGYIKSTGKELNESMAETRKGQVPMTLKPGETDDLEPEDFEGFRRLPEYLEGQKAQQKAGKDLIQQSPYTYQSDQDWAYRNGAFDQRQAASSANFTKRGPLTTEQGLSEEESEEESERRRFPNYYHHKDKGTVFRVQSPGGKTTDVHPGDEKWDNTYQKKYKGMPTPNDGGFWSDDDTAAMVEETEDMAESWRDIYNLNKQKIGTNPNLIKPDTVLKMPDGSRYKVKPGDNLSSIAKTSGTKSAGAKSNNPNTKPVVEPKYYSLPPGTVKSSPVNPAPADQNDRPYEFDPRSGKIGVNPSGIADVFRNTERPPSLTRDEIEQQMMQPDLAGPAAPGFRHTVQGPEGKEYDFDSEQEARDFVDRIKQLDIKDRESQGLGAAKSESIDGTVKEVNLGDYSKKAMVSQAGAKIKKFFGRDDPAAVAAADKTIANRERGMARADARRKSYTSPPVDMEKQRQQLTDKYPNIDELVRRAEVNRDPNYEYADGQAYYAGQEAEQKYQQLKKIQRIIQGLNEETRQATLNTPAGNFTANITKDKSTNTVSGTMPVGGATLSAKKDLTPGGAQSVTVDTDVAPNLNLSATQKSADYNKGQLAGTKSVSAKYTDTTGALGKPGQQHTATRTAGVGFGGASGARVGKNYVTQIDKTLSDYMDEAKNIGPRNPYDLQPLEGPMGGGGGGSTGGPSPFKGWFGGAKPGSREASVSITTPNTMTVKQGPNPDYVPPKTLQQKYDELNKKLDQLPPAPPVKVPRPGRAAADQRRLDQARASELKDVVPLSPAEKNQLRPVDADKLRRSDLDRRLDLDNVRPGIDEQSSKKREQPEVEYDDEYDAMVARVKKLAGLGPMKTVYDPKKRQYRNMPTAVQPKK